MIGALAKPVDFLILGQAGPRVRTRPVRSGSGTRVPVMSAVCPICGKSLDGFRERCPECVGLVPQGRGAIPPRRKSNGIGGIVAVGVGVLVLLLLGLGGLVIIAVFALG